MATRSTGTPASTAVAPVGLSHDELMAILGQTGSVAQEGTGSFRRMSLKSGSLITDEGKPEQETWPPTRKGPTMTVRIVKPPVYYMAFFLSTDEKNRAVNPNAIHRPDLDKRFVKKYDDPQEQADDQWSNVDVYDEVVRVAGNRGQFKADIQLQIVPESGEMTGDEPVYTLTLSTMSALDWRGSSRNPSGGVVQEKNFIVQLAELAAAQAVEAGGDKTAQASAVLRAMTALRLGGVIADVYLINTQSDNDASINWTVVAFKPVQIEYGEEQTALPAGDVSDDTADSDDLPF